MEKDSKNDWKTIKSYQRWELIGGTSPEEEGNGFHDRISFAEKYVRINNKYKRIENVLYNRFKDDLYQALTSFGNDNDNELFKFKNCSQDYIDTFNLYTQSQSHYRRELPTLFYDIARGLVSNGHCEFEFVSWKTREEKLFYGFEVKEILGETLMDDSRYIVENISYNDYTGVLMKQTNKIPKSKCITLKWPSNLGGVKIFEESMNSIRKIDNVFNIIDANFSIAKHKKADLDTYKALSEFGMSYPLEDTTEYYKVYSLFKFKWTVYYLLLEIQNGFKQLVVLLNDCLNEKAEIEFNFPTKQFYESCKYFDLWKKGEISFKTAYEHISPYQ